MIIAAATGAGGWEIFGNEVRSQLGIGQNQTPLSPSASVATPPADDDLVAAVKDLQASQNRTADQLDAALVLLNPQQASSKTMADSLRRHSVPRSMRFSVRPLKLPKDRGDSAAKATIGTAAGRDHSGVRTSAPAPAQPIGPAQG
jgi:hypothetical protein